MRRVPLRSIEIFVIAARALNLTTAAQTLGLTTSAVSRRIRDLELEIGADLFRRFNRRIELTPAGSQYLEQVGSAFDQVRAATDVLRQSRKRKLVKLATMPSIASAWLVPRIVEFNRQRPDIEVELETGSEMTDFATSDVHIGIRFGRGPWPGLVSEPLLDVKLFPMCAPNLVSDLGPVTATGLDRFALLSFAQSPGLWSEWLTAIGLPGYEPQRIKAFDSIQVLYESAAAGMGLALGAVGLTEPYLSNGRLTQAFLNEPVSVSSRYYLVYRPRDRNWEPLKAMRRVLLEGTPTRRPDQTRRFA